MNIKHEGTISMMVETDISHASLNIGDVLKINGCEHIVSEIEICYPVNKISFTVSLFKKYRWHKL